MQDYTPNRPDESGEPVTEPVVTETPETDAEKADREARTTPTEE